MSRRDIKGENKSNGAGHYYAAAGDPDFYSSEDS
jgi:hypothetical protein